MVFSEKEPADKQKMKNGIIAVGLLLAIFAGGPLIISEFTGVDINELCVEEEDTATCEEKISNGEIKSALQEGLGLVSIGVAVVSFIGLAIVGVKY